MAVIGARRFGRDAAGRTTYNGPVLARRRFFAHVRYLREPLIVRPSTVPATIRTV